MIPEGIDINGYFYELPDERIAKYPVEPRDSSRLLISKKGQTESVTFRQLGEYLPVDAHLVFNNTRVIPARLFFKKESGAVIEIFLLNPVSHQGIISQAMESHDRVVWECMVGNKKKWKTEEVTAQVGDTSKSVILRARWADRNLNHIELSWDHNDFSFAELVRLAGQMPLPPYLNRETETKDKETYQTVYAKADGAVAAPTAGLHFTAEVFEDLKKRGIGHTEITLHVGAGTFQPVKVQNALEHHMHSEQIVFSREELEDLLRASSKQIIPVGTTSMRSLESLYWYGVKLIKDGEDSPFEIEKLYPYQWYESDLPDFRQVLMKILDLMQKSNREVLTGNTGIYIFPGYSFKVCKGIITNFHQPKSTLLLLISALIGDKWKELYDFALRNDYRFLSYGDSSLLIP